MKISGTVVRGRRGRGLPRDRSARPRSRPDRPVARVRPPGALEQRLLLHARHVGPRRRAAAADGASTTTTPSRRGRASASSPRWSRRRPGRATPSPSRATSAASSNGPPTRAERGQAQPPPRGSSQPRSQRATRDDEGNVLTLRGSLTAGSRRDYAEALAGKPALARGRMPARAGAAVRAPRGALGDRRGADRAPSASCSRASDRLTAGARSGSARRCARHCAEHFPDVQAP